MNPRSIDKNQAKELIKETFESLFDKVRFTNFIKNLQQIGTTGKGTKYVLRRQRRHEDAIKTPKGKKAVISGAMVSQMGQK